MKTHHVAIASTFALALVLANPLLAPKDSANTKEGLQRYPNYDESLFNEVSGGQTVSLAVAGGMSGSGSESEAD